ncbi:YdeI/OmpD-associated family protein [Paremcibacter congregatus]|uniref:Bacteriocin-protection protein n=1 Tax=Paremcibacter congregatus TaxID=2043170 RepID=A0A2G4YQX4_9PROT|nr:YdeI/OmpD-associated family protein [Paremcibacter congregatus]PHZ84722.1 bacteriocin-protection protein [Paremcibacter congregatus]QDE28917.1 bacteriocin-protection protein [Paremcibacter congregatus]
MGEEIFFQTQAEFGDWLEDHAEASELWVGYFRKSTGRASLTWSETVDVALCYGWIDGIRKTIDDQSYKIRFTPRRTGSVWSAVNVKKVKALTQLGKMKPAGMYVFNKRTDVKGYCAQDRNLQLSRAYEAQIKTRQPAWLFLKNLAPSYRRESIWWVMSAKKEEARLKRLEILIASSEAGLKIPALRKKK